MIKTLKGLRVLNTRPQKQAQALNKSINDAGGIAIELPTIEIKETNGNWIKSLPDLKEVDQAIFISTNAVYSCFKQLKLRQIDWPKQIKVIAMGEGTAKALKEFDIEVTEMPAVSDSEHLLELSSLHNIEHQTLLLFKGEGGRKLLEQGLIQRGTNLIQLNVYKRVLPKINQQLIDSLWRDNAVDIILLTSEQSIKNLFKLFNTKAHAWLQEKTCIVFSARLAKAASLWGIKNIIICHPNAVMDSLLDYYQGSYMADSNEEQKQEKQLKNKSNIEINTPQKESNPTPSKNNTLISGVALLIAIAAVLVTAYSIRLNHVFQKKITDEHASLMNQVLQMKKQQNADQEQIATKTEQFKQVKESLQSQFNQLDKKLQNAMSQRFYQNQDWLLLKARYYLELAQINHHWSDNSKTSVALLQEADHLLKQINSTKIFEIRQALAKEIAQIKALPPVDMTGLLSKLDAAQSHLDNLSIKSSVMEHETKTEETSTSSETSGWRAHLENSLNALEKLVVIRRDDEDIQPLVSPLFESLARENIRLSLQEAQWAILNNHPDVYQFALKQAINNLKKTFRTSSTLNALLTQLKELQEAKVTQDKPQLDSSLSLLNQLIDNKEITNSEPKDSKGENE